MLNRRVLRIKAMQALYGSFLMKKAVREMLKEELVAQYEFDPMEHDFTEKEQIMKRKTDLGLAFDEQFDVGQGSVLETLEPSLRKEIKSFVDQYDDKLSAEIKLIEKDMLREVEHIESLYIRLLLLPGELAFIEQRERDKASRTSLDEWNYNLTTNSVVDHLNTLPELVDLAIKKKISWKGKTDELQDWYRTVLRRSEHYEVYQGIAQPTLDDHRGIVETIYKKLIFKEGRIDTFFRELDLHWSENKPILKSLVLKTIKGYTPELESKFELRPLSYNQEEDVDYFRILFEETIDRDRKLDEYIHRKTKNWDLNRIALLDFILLKMALTEMIVFPSIPVKVTINEFIEISKNYSTPKSKQFINGILDVLANELTSEGVIKKSGRGLIDNK